jgi:predicted Zn-ribbon and HTH transcriptional regulator
MLDYKCTKCKQIFGEDDIEVYKRCPICDNKLTAADIYMEICEEDEEE